MITLSKIIHLLCSLLFIILPTNSLIEKTDTEILANYKTLSFLPLHVDGNHLVDTKGKIHILHGFAQTYSPWFNERGSKWDNYNVTGCLLYNKGKIDEILNAGWKMTFVRIHLDIYWSNTPGVPVTGENDISAFDFDRFKLYMDEVFVPMIEYIISKKLYVVIRPPGVCPKEIAVGDEYQSYLLKVWEYVAQHNKLKDNGYILFELANEPIEIIHSEEVNEFEALRDYFQPIVNIIRQHSTTIVLVPGLGYSSLFSGLKEYKFQGTNLGFAAHCYPGWFNSAYEGDEDARGYQGFKEGWEAQIGIVTKTNPVVITEMDWAPSKYDASWGKATTGTAGGKGFGANFIKIADESEVSWLLFTGQELLAQYDDSLPDSETFLTDPEACPRPIYRKYLEYYTKEADNEDNNKNSANIFIGNIYIFLLALILFYE